MNNDHIFTLLVQCRCLISLLVGVLTLTSCSLQPESTQQIPKLSYSIQSDRATPADSEKIMDAQISQLTSQHILNHSWQTYRQRFIQPDGRVIDREDRDRSISEGQAYAMLRAVLIDDTEVFARVLTWAEDNLRYYNTLDGERPNSLWAWQWGRRDDDSWGILDDNFASDADIDAITALILASRRWNQPDYLTLAQQKLEDLWNYSTLVTVSLDDQSVSKRYLLPGPMAAFVQHSNQKVYLNPSYMAPYAFRLFAQVDPERDWMSLVESSYSLLEISAQLSTAQLPSDWVVLDTRHGQVAAANSNSLQSVYGFDAYRVWWRLKLDQIWFNEPRAKTYLQAHSKFLVDLWHSHRSIPARIDALGEPDVGYESTAQYAMLYFGLKGIEESVAQEIFEEKIEPSYQDGFWDNDLAYYVQNLSWFALYPFDQVEDQWLI